LQNKRIKAEECDARKDAMKNKSWPQKNPVKQVDGILYSEKTLLITQRRLLLF
jgi:hypothetical protein